MIADCEISDHYYGESLVLKTAIIHEKTLNDSQEGCNRQVRRSDMGRLSGSFREVWKIQYHRTQWIEPRVRASESGVKVYGVKPTRL